MYKLCLESFKAWFDGFFAMPLERYTILNCGGYSCLVYVLMFLYKITTLKDVAWNTTAARQVLDALPTLERVLGILEQLKMCSSDLGPDEVISTGIRKLNTLKIAWQTEMAAKI
jgi:hypothetical protein